MDISPKAGLFLDGGLEFSARDPAVHYDAAAGVYRCWFTLVEGETGRMCVAETTSANLTCWSAVKRVTVADGNNFSSPGNLVRAGGEWVLCLQSYPITPGESYANEDCRLWLMRGKSPAALEAPRLAAAEGCTAHWAKSPRQIDPYLVQKDGAWYLFYKTQGCLGVMVSRDLVSFADASPERPVLRPEDTPDGATVENPCVIYTGGEYRMFFAPCRAGRGIGTAVSQDLLHWQGVRYLDFEAPAWATGGPTAPFVLDDRARSGKWLLFYHGDMQPPHGGALALAHSDDLENWKV